MNFQGIIKQTVFSIVVTVSTIMLKLTISQVLQFLYCPMYEHEATYYLLIVKERRRIYEMLEQSPVVFYRGKRKQHSYRIYRVPILSFGHSTTARNKRIAFI